MQSQQNHRLLIHSAKQIVQVVKNGERNVSGRNLMNDLATLETNDKSGYSIVVDNFGKICNIGTDEKINEKYSGYTFSRTINATGKTIIPGLVDAHTHAVWAGDRVHEFEMKLAGATYMEVHAAGGGIHFTVSHTRLAEESVLLESLLGRLSRMLRCGTVLAEVKSGYGLDLVSELKLLKVIEQAKKKSDVSISTTFCGAHSVPKGMSSEEATEDILKEQIPVLKAYMDSEELGIDNIDVFCEKGVFDVDQSRRILLAGQKIGLQLNFHGDELNPMGAAEMGAALNAKCISHLEEISDSGISAMAESGTAAVILPTTAFELRLKCPPVRKMIDSGVVVALGSDFNPNAYCLSMPLVMHLACVTMKMTMQEALFAATINSASALGKSDTNGSIEIGKEADLIILNAPRWEHLIYQLGCHDHVIESVIKKGVVVYNNPFLP